MITARPTGVRMPLARLVPPVIVGMVAIAVGLNTDPVRTWSNLLVAGFYVLSVALGGMLFIAVQQLSGAAWSVGMRRVAEAMTCALPVAALMMILLFFGRGDLFAWAAAAPVGERAAGLDTRYFAVPFVAFRSVLFLGLWMVFAWLMRRTSEREDVSDDPIHHRRMLRYSAVFIVLFALSFSLASVDWLLALDPRWMSTIYAVYAFAGLLVQGVAAVTLVVVLLHEHGHLADEVNANHLHDLGKLLLALTTFWAYIWLCQYLLIWYGNLPDEVTYYVVRTGPRWVVLFFGNLVVNWLIPFGVLLPRAAKRSPSVLKWIAVVILIGRWLDVYLLVMPQTMKAPAFGLLELSIAVAYGSVLWFVVSAALARQPLVVLHDPLLFECLRHEQ
jgi:hypothetical protein